MTFDIEAAKKHTIAAINAAPLSLDPFPHLMISGILPDEVYQMVLDNWPADSAFYSTNSQIRKEFSFGKLVKALSEDQAKFWVDINECFATSNIAVRERLMPYADVKFVPYLGDDWKAEVGEVEYTPDQIHFAVYTGRLRLSPHVDNIRLVTNAFVYISEKLDGEEPDLGTVLYRARGMVFPTNWNLQPKLLAPYLDKVATSSYAANSCFAYINSPNAFHGVEPADIGDRERRLLMFGSKMYVREMNRIFGEKICNANF
jgi:hypothetical protein